MGFQSTQPKRAATTGILCSSAFVKFQSTQPKRAATEQFEALPVEIRISIHAAQEGCDFFRVDVLMLIAISIHAAQEGCDDNKAIGCKYFNAFQSTQPKRAATTVA